MTLSFDRYARAGFLVLTAVVVILCLYCTKRSRDPFDKTTIERDFEERTVRDLYDEVEGATFEPPADRRLNEQQIESFNQCSMLADRIREVAGRRLDDQIDRAGAANDRFARGTWAASAIGSARAIGTAELRAAVNLSLNPLEQQWIAQEIARCTSFIQEEDTLDKAVAQAKKELDDEIDFGLIPRRKRLYDKAVKQKRTWSDQQGEPVLANILLVRAMHEDRDVKTGK